MRGRKNIIDPYDKIVSGVGFFGEGPRLISSLKGSWEYVKWANMLRRCYGTPLFAYEGCTVHDNWHNFQHFSVDCRMLFEGAEDDWQLDKDLLVKYNKVYSVDTCIAVPPYINKILQSSRKSRGPLPLGVSWHKTYLRFAANCQVRGKTKFIGYYSTAETAFYAYKKFKEKLIKDVVDEHRCQISDKLYAALTNYEILITD